MLSSVPASAVIVSGALTGGNVPAAGVFQVTILPSIEVNTINSPNVIGINEQQNFTLGTSLRVFTVAASNGNYPAGTAGSVVIGAGTVVNSHLIFLDPTDNNINQGGGGTTAIGTVTFNTPILGYIFATGNRGGANFPNTNYLGATGTVYGPLHPTLEGQLDAVSFSGKTLSFALDSNRNVGDYLRVITAVPEPKSWAMLIAGFGLVGAAARRRQLRTA